MKGEKYQLFWPEESEFVRMAVKFGATIVPFAGVGMEDSVEILLDGNEMQNIPVVSTYLKDQLEKYVPKARTGVSADVAVDGKTLTVSPYRNSMKSKTFLRSNEMDVTCVSCISALDCTQATFSILHPDEETNCGSAQ